MNTYKAIRNEISSDNMMATVHQLAKWKDIQAQPKNLKHSNT